MSNQLLIAFDAKRAAQNRTGLGNYSRYILDGLISASSDIGIYLCTPNTSLIEDYKQLLKNNNVSEILPIPVKLPLAKAYWRSRGVVRQLKLLDTSVFHGLSNEIPFGLKSSGIKSVVTIHDLIFRRYPQYYTFIDRNIYDFKFKYACRHADKIVAISECTKRDIIELYGIDPLKIEVIYQGCSPRFSESIPRSKLDEVRRTYNLPDRYILSVGSIEERKNANLIVQALPLMKEQNIPLILVGKRTNYTREIEETAHRLNVSHRLMIIENLPFSDLPSVYRMAELFVYPSRYEGFGIPIVEAQASRIPVIGATGSCLEEAGGEHSLYTHPDDPQQLSEMIDRVLSDHGLREEMIDQGEKYIEQFSSEHTTAQLLYLYQSI